MASWFAGVQLAGCSILSLFRLHKSNKNKFIWIAIALIALCLSFLEVTRFHERVGIGQILNQALSMRDSLLFGIAKLVGVTLVFQLLSQFIFRDQYKDKALPTRLQQKSLWLYYGVAGVAGNLFLLQIILFQMLIIYSNYLTAVSIISIALLGIAVGGLIAFLKRNSPPITLLIPCSLFLPIVILLSFGATFECMKNPFVGSILLTFPFILGGVIISTALITNDSHRIYFTDLLGAGIAALSANTLLTLLREENCFLFLMAEGFLSAACFIQMHPHPAIRKKLQTLAFLGVSFTLVLGFLNFEQDWLNVVRKKVVRKNPQATILFSRSSLISRIDIVKKTRKSNILKVYENGHSIDTLRKSSTHNYQIDPRIPHTLMKNPDIFILGLSGDGVTKTAKCLGRRVYGVEINPAIVHLMTHELLPYNSNNYGGINVHMSDGRNYLEQASRSFDMITLLNSHIAKGKINGQNAFPEYLHTLEAFELYLKRLTKHGILILEEPLLKPRQEPAIWKLLRTMRQALLNQKAFPEKHFFVFQWKTYKMNYVQILIKKEPFSQADIFHLKSWLNDVENIRKKETLLGFSLGPIHTARTILLYEPFGDYQNNYAKMVTGKENPSLKKINLNLTTDQNPFPFDTDPKRLEIKRMYGNVLLMTLPLLFFIILLTITLRHRMQVTANSILIVILTGLGYLLIEVNLIQRLGIFLGSPIRSFSTVLGTLLFFSGLGSLCSQGLQRKKVVFTLFSIPCLLLMTLLFLNYFHNNLSVSLGTRTISIVLLLAPLAFLMGIPFPSIISEVKAQKSIESVALLFAVNGIGSALAVPLSLNLSVVMGIDLAFLSGTFVYAIVAFLFLTAQTKKLQYLVHVLAISILLGFISLVWSPSPVKSSVSPENLKVYGISYGHSKQLEWLYWVIRGQGRTILVDTGFRDKTRAQRNRISQYVYPTSPLRKMGIHPSDVTDIVISHTHWDHVGDLASYPHAKIWIQKKEYNNNRLKNPDLFKALESLKARKKLVLVHGIKELIPGVRMVLGRIHTPGSQYLEVKTDHGIVIIAGDIFKTYQEIYRQTPMPSSRKASLLQELYIKAASPFYILPGHDPQVLEYFPKISKNIVSITPLPYASTKN